MSHFRLALSLLAALAVVPLIGAVKPPAADEPDEKEVQAATAKAIAYLKSQQQRDGKWERGVLRTDRNYPGGGTALAMAALLEAGVKPDDEAITKAIDYVRKLPTQETYVVALQTLVLAKVDPKKDQPILKRNVDWFKKTLKRDRFGNLLGWSYPGRGEFDTDNSNTQFAVLALHTASQAGVEVDDKLWREIRMLYIRSQMPSGGWQYRNQAASVDRLTMSSAGVCGLLIAAEHLGDKDPITERAIENGLERVNEIFTVDNPPWRFYSLWCMARRGRLLGKTGFTARKGTTHDWYREGARFLLDSQTPGGGWQSPDPVDGQPVVATSFALLFLGKGR